jgi:hypothetical protein
MENMREVAGHRPWRPFDGAELVETWDFYDMPLSGLLRVGPELIVFACEDGELSDWNVWTYVDVAPDEVEAIARAENVREAIESLRLSHPYAVGVANDAHGLVRLAAIDFEVESYPTSIAAAQAAFPDLAPELKHLVEPRGFA